ncbi:hypothetical protein CK203_082044 [Vitis vinifera]|uniref:PDZ domain-containing protein n=1 Tax=Vitis vinifera TaxID=29760 RepID=A0A438E1V3_VITVI|nr:hypothetical protein CK203_082044 [Vitis vinifera]
MASAVVAGTSSSCSAAFTRTHSIKPSSTPPPKPLTPSQSQKTTFQGLSLQDAKRGFSNSVLAADSRSSFASVRRGLEITARTAGAAKNIEVEAVEGGGNAAKAGLKAGDQVLYTSSFFGDELWPADKLGFTKTAIQAKPDSVYFVVSSSWHPNTSGKVMGWIPLPFTLVIFRLSPNAEVQRFVFKVKSFRVTFCRLEQLTYA